MDSKNEGPLSGVVASADRGHPTGPAGPGNPGDRAGRSQTGTETGRVRRRNGHLALIAVQLCFGLFPILGKVAMSPDVGLDALGIASWRILFGALVLSALAFGVFRKRCLPPRREWGLLLACACLGIVFNQGLFLQGLQRSTAINAGLITCLIPVFTFVIAALARQEAFHWVRALGVLVALAGIGPMFLGQGAEMIGPYGVGNALMVANTISFAGYLVVSKGLTARYPALLVITWIYVFSLPFLPFFMLRARMLPLDVQSVHVWASLGYILVFATVISYLLNVFALARVRASTTAIYVYLQPLITGVAAYWLLHEELGAGLLRAAIMLFIGIALVTRRPESAPNRNSD